MPWHIESDNPDCSGWAVVLDSTGEVAGCHMTRQQALAHMAALYANARSLTLPQRSQAMKVERKSFVIEAKDDAQPGAFAGYAAVWDNTDSYGDVMLKGAFAASIAERGLPMLSWEHEWAAGPIGLLTKATEDDYGLLIDGQLFVDDPLVKRIYASMKAGQVGEMSFAFLTKEADSAEREGETVRLVKQVDWLEAAVVVKGANDRARILAVRSALTEPDFSADDERFAAALDEAVSRFMADQREEAGRREAEAARREYLQALTDFRLSEST